MARKNKKKQEVAQETQNIDSTNQEHTEQLQEIVSEDSVKENVELLKEELKIEQKQEVIEKVEELPQRFDPIAYARQNVSSFSPAWVDSLRAYQRHLGLSNELTEAECINFLTKWGIKF